MTMSRKVKYSIEFVLFKEGFDKFGVPNITFDKGGNTGFDVFNIRAIIEFIDINEMCLRISLLHDV